MRNVLVGFVLLVAASSIQTKPIPPNHISKEDVQCLAANIHFEARGESKRGQIAVAHVTLNRLKNSKFPKSVCKVVKQPGQFSWYKNINITQVKFSTDIQQLAIDVLAGKYKDPTRGALFFHNTSVGPFDRKEKTRIGSHIFYG